MDGWMDGRADEWMAGSMVGLLKESLNGWREEWAVEYMSE